MTYGLIDYTERLKYYMALGFSRRVYYVNIVIDSDIYIQEF